MDVRALLHNKWALAGAGVAGVAGIVVYLRRKAAGGSTSSSTGAQSSPAYSGGVGGFDSTGTDVAAQLGQYQANTQNILDQYQQQLTGALAGLSQVPAGTTGTGTGPATQAQAGPQTVSIGKGSNLYDFAAGHGTTLDQLRTLNPGLDKLINWSGSGSTKDPLITKGLPLRVS